MRQVPCGICKIATHPNRWCSECGAAICDRCRQVETNGPHLRNDHLLNSEPVDRFSEVWFDWHNGDHAQRKVGIDGVKRIRQYKARENRYLVDYEDGSKETIPGVVNAIKIRTSL